MKAMMTEKFDTGLPSVRQVQTLIKANTEVEVKLSTNDLLVGKICWQDANCLCLVQSDGKTAIIWQQSLVFIQPKQ
jgi:host factor-I protein